MKKINVGWCCCAVIALGVLCGCETVVVPPDPKTDIRQGNPAEPVFGRPQDGVTMYTLESCARQLMADMKANATFTRRYEEKMKSKNNEKPTVIVEDIKMGYSVTNRVTHKFIVVRDVIRTELFNSDMFKRLPNGAKSSPDFVVYGRFEDVPEFDGRHNYYLYIGIKDFKDDSSSIWEGFRNNVNLDL